MAKRKKRKQSNSSSFKFSVEIVGLILILIGVIGLGVFGPVGNIIKEFAIFLFGSYYNALIVLVLILGSYMLFKRKLPNFFNSRLVGLYLVFIVILTFAHMNYVDAGIKIGTAINSSTEVYLSVIGNGNYVGLSQTGGGIIGLLSSWCMVSLLDKIGTYIILVVISLFALIMLFNVSFTDLIDKIQEMWANRKRTEHKEKKPNSEKTKIYDQDEESDDDILIKTVQDLKQDIKEEEPIHNEVPLTPVQEVPLITINSNYRLPKLDEVLDPVKKNKKQSSDEFIKQTSIALQNVLADFQITGKVVDYHEGPTVTQFEVAIKNGTKVSRITGISKEIALALAAKDVRIEAPIPGKTTVGIEIPNKITLSVQVREVLESRQRDIAGMKIPVSLGKDINGNNCVADLSKTPHLLVAGSTGSGKSVCINSFINRKVQLDQVNLFV